MKAILVVGGGITGVTTAYALQKIGYEVTLMERHRYVAMETSFANGGQLSASNAQVWNHQDTLLKAAAWLFKKDAPLLIRPKLSWHQISWFWQFLRSIPQYEKNTIATASMAIAARKFLFEWAKEENIEFNHFQEGILHVYRSRAEFLEARKVSKLLARGGLERNEVSPMQINEIESTLRGNFYGGFYTPSDSTGDIHLFTTGLAKAFVRRGGQILVDQNLFKIGSDGVKINTISYWDNVPAKTSYDMVVVCAGVNSRAIAAQLGDDINIYPVKGYSITVNLTTEKSQQAAPTVSLLDDATKIVTSRLGVDRFRVAGTAEFDGYNYDIRANRIAPLTHWVNQCFPAVCTRSVVPWAGLRPMMPSMMPFVGRGRYRNVFYNTGHGHLGWTLSAATADKIATIIALSA